ncbi:MAG: peptidase M64, partial [Gammaproteobacteria bacterium]|nr:peptidase M64 [Gammaproteobacteria bacterium]
MKILIGSVLSMLLTGCATAGAETPKTMRIDYVHSGNHETEMFSLDQLLIEPLPWTGNMRQPLDQT